MRPPRRLTPDESAMWRKVAATVTPLERRRKAPAVIPQAAVSPPTAPSPEPTKIDLAAALSAAKAKAATAPRQAAVAPRRAAPRVAEEKLGLDASWERKIARGGLEPDFSLDLHGSTLDQAYSRLMHGLAQARAMGARVVLIVTGKPRPVEAADRGGARGAIRAKIADWLAASDHASDIAAVRGAHRRHGGQGALYVVLKRRR